MQKNLAIILQAIVVVLGTSVLTLLLWEPHLEGRNVNATLFEIYFRDPFLAYVYIASIPFFVALYKWFQALEYAKQNKAYSEATATALRTIQRCAMLLIAFILGAEAYIFTVQRSKEEDIAGGVAIGLFMIIISVVVAFIATRLGRLVQRRMTTNL